MEIDRSVNDMKNRLNKAETVQVYEPMKPISGQMRKPLYPLGRPHGKESPLNPKQ